MYPKLFDIHSHLNLLDFDQDWKEVLARTLEADCWTITVGADLASSRKAVEIAESKDNGVWATIGFHPTDAVDLSAESWAEMDQLARNPKVVAIGECGLEYFQRISNVKSQMENEMPEIQKEKQKDVFRKHIELALEIDKPLMIHCRPSKGSMDAYEEALHILAEYVGAVPRGARRAEWENFHFFAGDLLIAQQCVDLGFTLSFTGVITFTDQYDEVIKNVPLEKLMAETDAPYVAPVPYRGQRCEPLFVAEVVRRMAEIKGLDSEEMAGITVLNARRMFNV